MRIAALLVALLAAAAAQAIDFPPLTGRVVDAAGILSAGTRSDLTRQLEAHERVAETAELCQRGLLPHLEHHELVATAVQPHERAPERHALHRAAHRLQFDDDAIG